MLRAPQSSFKTIALASDHAGFERKQYVYQRLVDAGYSVVDYGPTTYAPDDDYPETIRPAVRALEPQTCAILFGKSGQGEAIVANRYPGVRAAVYAGGSTELVTLARAHNDANALSLGAGFLSNEEAWDAVVLFLNTPFSEEPRHVRRIQSIDA